MREFFQVISIRKVLDMAGRFPLAGTEEVEVFQACGRILAKDVVSKDNVPAFARSTMDGYAVSASSTFGASEGIPAMLEVAGRVEMGTTPEFSVGPGQAALMPTGGMLPEGTDAVVMVEHTEILDDKTIEVYKSVAPLGNVLDVGDDVKKDEVVLKKGVRLRPQDLAVAASVGEPILSVYKKPIVGIVSTGDEVVSADQEPGPGQIRDMNTYALGGLCHQAGAEYRSYGIVGDDPQALRQACEKALNECDMLLVSGGSSVGARDHTIEVIEGFENSDILVHGVSISPGKPTILAKVGDKQVWGLPGHVTSAMVVFHAMVRPFIHHVAGYEGGDGVVSVPAKLARNVPSVQGRTDYVRIRLVEKDGELTAEPIFGKSGVIRTMVEADGFIQVDLNEEGLDPGTMVRVDLFEK
ncbi:molybdenum cofactor synthesis domain protein [Desulfatibacillum aliphaticivorans]|uniref:Molybdopterin molybdenumtransferase n=1 Tax=Desulfatibacillum aliphaticivorans TaxID=218208 RepID=B8FCU3_DESAL|nr:gephyrin-like molybdotransferase Glp [Desulfatibacillum aliphaticivorans]ACL06374.1 molybdenum cofactor synthesis domain protein [Desulfatibacillum aliphaticivorans]